MWLDSSVIESGLNKTILLGFMEQVKTLEILSNGNLEWAVFFLLILLFY